MYFFSNSPVKWRLTKVVCSVNCQLLFSYCLVVCHALRRLWLPRTFSIECKRPQHTFPVPPSPTSTSLKVGTLPAASAMVAVCCGGVCGVDCAKSSRGEMSAAVGESSARNWLGSRRTHLFSREWVREGRVEWRGNEEVVLKIWMLAAGGQRSLAGQCHFPSLVSHFPQQRQLATAGKGSPLGTDQAGFVLEIKHNN